MFTSLFVGLFQLHEVGSYTKARRTRTATKRSQNNNLGEQIFRFFGRPKLMPTSIKNFFGEGGGGGEEEAKCF